MSSFCTARTYYLPILRTIHNKPFSKHVKTIYFPTLSQPSLQKQDYSTTPSTTIRTITSPSLFQSHFLSYTPNKRYFTTTESSQTDDTNINQNAKDGILIYEGALSGLTTRLKRISIVSCAFGIIGLPTASLVYGIDASVATQAAVGGTALIAAVGSTVALHYCFAPYVHTLEKIPKPKTISDKDSDSDIDVDVQDTDNLETDYYIRATTRNLMTMKVETIFDPNQDVLHNTSRPFCTFIAKGVPMVSVSTFILYFHNDALWKIQCSLYFFYIS